MKNMSTAFATHIAGEVTSLASCWHINRTDGVQLYFTDHDQDLLVDGNLYLASDGYDRGALKCSNGTSTDEMEIQGNINSDNLKEEDLSAGLFDYAEIHFFIVNWQNLSAGSVPIRKGWMGEVTWKDGRFTAELRGLSNALKHEIGRVYTPECQADFGDASCGLNLELMAANDTVATVNERKAFTLNIFNEADGILDGGLVHFLSGNNAGRKFEIRKWQLDTKEIELFLEPPFDVEVGDEITVYPGCDKGFQTCRIRFANVVNFQGFPYIPGTDALAENSNG